MLLTDLGAIDEQGAITVLGRRMIAFPAHPRYARMLLAAQDYGCVRAVALIAALTQGRDLLARRQGKQTEDARDELVGDEVESDFFVLMRAWRFAERNGYHIDRCRRIGVNASAARQVAPLFEQFLRIASAEGLDISEKPIDSAAVQRCVLVGFSDHLARRLDPGSLRCELVHGRRGLLARESVVKAPLFVASDVSEVETGGGRERALSVMLNFATAIKEEWLRELFPRDFKKSHAVVYDPTSRRVVARDETRFRDLVLEEKLSNNPPAEETARILASEVAAGRCALQNWSEAVEQWILRVNRLREWMPELELPAIGEEEREAMRELICHGAFSADEIRARAVLPVVKSWLSRQQQMAVEDYAPERLGLPNGRTVKVVYAVDGPPTIAARIQDLYGIKEALWIAGRRVPVRIQVLAPNNRPVQITENLSVFWRETYPKLKQELQRRYPKHVWR
jgi:ATP-dependent helicase HrpB